MKSTFKENVSALGLSYSKVVWTILLFNIAVIGMGAAAYIFIKKLLVIFIALGVLLVMNFVLITRYSSLKETSDKEHLNEFIELISYFQIYISNNTNVYQSLLSIMPYSSSWTRLHLQKLINQIDVDKSVKPYVDYAANYPNTIVQSVMLSIYQMIDQGENMYQISQFTILFDNLNRERKQAMISEKQRSLEGTNIFPLFGTGIITLLITFGLLMNLGDMIIGF